MGKFDDNKPNPHGRYPIGASHLDTPGAAGFTRIEEWLTPERLKQEFLFGIPLFSPITRQKLDDETLKTIIRREAANIELELQVDIFPVQRIQRLDFDRTKYLQGWNQLKLEYKNINSLQEVSIRAVNSESIQNNFFNSQPVQFSGPDNDGNGSVLYEVPLEWIDMTYAHKGTLHFVPLQTTFTGTGLAGGSTTGAAAPLFAVWSKLQWIPSFWFVRYTTGFGENAIPAPYNDLIGVKAAMNVLSQLSPLNRYNSQSTGVDGISQGLSGPGVQIYTQRYNELKEKEEKLKNVIKSRFNSKIKMTHW